MKKQVKDQVVKLVNEMNEFNVNAGFDAYVIRWDMYKRGCYSSTEDIKITNKIKTAGDMLNIRMIDHIIMGDDNYYSFHDNGLI